MRPSPLAKQVDISRMKSRDVLKNFSIGLFVGTSCSFVVLGFVWFPILTAWILIAVGLVAAFRYYSFQADAKLKEQALLLIRLINTEARCSLQNPEIVETVSSRTEMRSLIENLEQSLVWRLAANIVSKHIKTLRRKKKLLCVSDEYGVEDSSRWTRELHYFCEKVLLPQLQQVASRYADYPITSSPSYIKDVSSGRKTLIDYWGEIVLIDVDSELDNEILIDAGEVTTGHEYEIYICDLLKQSGWAGFVTPATGDHGADVIAEKGGTKVAIQCKWYTSPVGNDAVQEAYSARELYDCQYACVVTSSQFTRAARLAGNKLSVLLVHHNDIADRLNSLLH